MPPPIALLETIRVRGGRIPLLDRHLARFERAREELGLPPPVPDLATLARSFAGAAEAVLRIAVADGQARLTVQPFVERSRPAVITATSAHVPYRHKTTARHAFEAAAAEASQTGADDALLLTSTGEVAEGTTWSVFWWEGERLVTPTLGLGVLVSVARARVLELRSDVVEGASPRGALTGRSVFLANAVRGVQSLSSLDGLPVPEDPRTSGLARAFWPLHEDPD